MNTALQFWVRGLHRSPLLASDAASAYLNDRQTYPLLWANGDEDREELHSPLFKIRELLGMGLHRKFCGSWIKVPSALLLVSVLASCGGGDKDKQDPGNSQPPSVDVVHASQGGSVEGPDGSGIEIPPGALRADTPVSIRKLPADALTLPTGSTITGSVYEFMPAELEFAQQVTLTLPAPDEIPEGRELAVLEYEKPAVQPREIQATAASTGEPKIRCAGQAQGFEAIRFFTRSSGPKAVVSVPKGSCTASEYLLPVPLTGAPEATFTGCGLDEAKYAETRNDEVKLVNRHVACEKTTTELTVIESDPTPGLPNRTLGKVSVQVLLSVSGPNTKLAKQMELRFRIASKFEPDASNIDEPAPSTRKANLNPTIHFGVEVNCVPDSVNQGTCSLPTTLETVSLAANSTTWSRPLTVPVNFQISPTASPSIAYFSPIINLRSAVANSPNDARHGHYFGSQLSVPTIRCDQNIIQEKRQGCVFPQAAAVLVMSRSEAKYREAAEHIAEAQASGSPGAFKLKEGTRAISDGSASLQRVKYEIGVDANRFASCTGSSSLYNTRPLSQSASCTANGTDCQCDEYPFASTRSGGRFSPTVTSVKKISGPQNVAGGRALGTFLSRERVLDLSTYTGATPTASTFDPLLYPFDSRSDNFWVMIK